MPQVPSQISALLLVTSLLLAGATRAQELPSPEAFYGFEMGADRKLARWDKMVEYYQMLGERSDRMQVVDMGPTTLDNRFLALYISSPENLANLEEYKRLNALLSDPRQANSDAEIEEAIANGKVVFVQSYGLHSSEVAGAQTPNELVYDMLTRDDDEMLRILDNTISILIPCFNPDGQIMITDWYNEYVGTEYEGAGMPWLYHHYIGHDNNRDAFMQNTVESVYGAQIMFKEWIPQGFIDHHQMGAYRARLYVPPYSEPIRPEADPLVWREMAWYGAHIAYKEEEAGRSGVVNAAIYSGWGHFGFHWITPFHNIAGMLTESASARLASPLYVHPDQLTGSPYGMPEHEAQTTYPNPWEGGWWRVRDIVEQQLIASIAPLDIAARNRETVLRNAYLKAKRQTERGAEGSPAAFVIPVDQHDPLTAQKLVNRLLGQGIEVMQAVDDFTHEGRVYERGAYVVTMAQPKRGVIRWLLGRTFYPDNAFTRLPDGSPKRPYDMSTDNLAEYMGVRVDPVETPVQTGMLEVTSDIVSNGSIARGSNGYQLSGRFNDAFKAVNLLLDQNHPVYRVHQVHESLKRGDFILPATIREDALQTIAAESGVDFTQLDVEVEASPVRRRRIGMYQRYLGGNMDEGWTRLLLENFGFPYTTLKDDAIKAGNLQASFDVIILPDDSPANMTGESTDVEFNRRRDTYPPEYRSGFGKEGIAALEAFVKAGGKLITFARAGELVIKAFKLPVRNVVAGMSTNDFWSPGSTLRMNFDTDHPLAFGMPERGVGLFLLGNQAYEVIPSSINHRIHRVATFVERGILQSGWLLGEDKIAEKASVLSVGHGEGEVVLIGFRAQHRHQTHGTFKLVFNALVD